MVTGVVKEVGLNGLTSTQSDYDGADGDLRVCHNMIGDGAGLEAINDVEVKFTLPDGMDECVFVHKTTAGDSYIAVGTDANLYAYKESDGQLDGVSLENFGAGLYTEGDYGISSIGNILVVSIHNGGDYDGLHYYRWMSDAAGGGYDYLGQYPPDINLEFELQYMDNSAKDVIIGESDISGAYQIDGATCFLNKTNTCTIVKEAGTFNFEESEEIWNHAMAYTNVYVNKCKKKTWFLQPFFVRYAYKLYDGSYMLQSSPVLMVPDYNLNPFFIVIRLGWISDGEGTMQFMGYARPASLRYRLACSEETLTELKKWEDVISGIAIAITPQMLSYSTSGTEINFENSGGGDLKNGMTLAIQDGYAFRGGTFSYESGKDASYYALPDSALPEKTDDDYTNIFVGAGYVKTEDANTEVENTYIYRIIKTLDMDDVKSIGTWMRAEDVDLTVLDTLEQLPDGYYERFIKMPYVMHTYNGRLNLCNVKGKERGTIGAGVMSCWTAFAPSLPVLTSQQDMTMDGTLTVYVEDGGFVNMVTAEISQWGYINSMPGFFFYPNPNAKYVQFKGSYKQGSTSTSVEYWWKLKTHPFLNGAYFFNGYYGYRAGARLKPSEVDTWEEKLIEQRNYLYTSEVGNPFVYPASGVEAIGNGQIVTIKEATKAVSEGTAFGTMPLYAFCTDGIWSLSVGDTGLYSAKQPVSRETLLNDDANCATQVDNSILFISDRGLMELSGGSTRLLSASLQERNSTYDAKALPAWSKIHTAFGGGEFMDADDFMDYIKRDGARIAFDYERYRAVIYHRGDAAAYVYAIATGTWATMENRIKSSLEGFPATLLNLTAADGGTEVGVFSLETSTPIGDGRAFYLTRPLKLGEADTLKTVRTLAEHGVRAGDGERYLALWGSRDMRRWALVGAVIGSRIPRLSGTPYKWFVVGGWTRFTAVGERISRLTLESKGKWKDKVR